MWVSCHSRSFKLVPFKSLDAVSYSPSIVTMAVSKIVIFHTPLAFNAPVRGVAIAVLPSHLVRENVNSWSTRR